MKQLVHFIWLILLSQQAFSQTITWTGATDTDWATGTNWSTNVAPTAADNVFVPGSLARYPVLNGSTSIKSLAVQSGSLLTINASHTLTISGAGVGYSIDLYGTIENNGTIAVTATSDAVYLNGNGKLNNNTGATLSITTTGNYGVKINNSGVLTNQTGATATITGNSGSLFLYGANTPVEMVKNYGKMTLTGQIEKYTDTFHNYPCGVVILTSGEVHNNTGQIINEGFFSVLGAHDLPANLNGPASNFINNGIIYVVNPNPSYTNNAIRIFNNATSTSIFEFAAANNLTVEGIYKDEAASASAGGFNQGTNTFTHFGLSAGSQTLYANITRSGGTCPQIVPFTFEVATASTFTTQPASQIVCAGSSASFTVAIANATGYQWQIDAGSGWTNVAATSPYANVNSATLNISNVDGLNGYQYRCVATGPGGATLTSNAATLTIGAGGGSNPTGTLTWTGLVDTDWNTACNWSPSSVPTATNDVVIPNTTNKPIINIAAVAKTVEVQAGAVLTINATKSLTINGSKLIEGTTSGLFNAGTVHNSGQLILGNTSSVGSNGFVNTGTFNNNLGAEITIDRATDGGLVNRDGGVFTNVAKITIGLNASVGVNGLSNLATFNNNTGGEITINRINTAGLYNYVGGTFTNTAKISIGTITPTMANGLDNRGTFFNNAGGDITIDNTTAFGLFSTSDNLSIHPPATFTNASKITIGATALASIGLGNANGATFNNNAGGEIKIDRSTSTGLYNEGGTFNNAAKITLGATASVGLRGIQNQAIFNNNAGGEIKIDNTTEIGLRNLGGTFTNVAKITIGATASVGLYGLQNDATFNNTGGEIKIDRSIDVGLLNAAGTFTNVAKITFGATANVGSFGIFNRATFNNNTGGIISIDNSSSVGIAAAAGSTLTNAATILIGATVSIGSGSYGLINDGAVNNTACGKLIVASGILQNNASRTITNTGLVQVAGTLDNNGTFTNNGVLKYGSLTGTVTNATNASLIVNNTPTPIFTYGGTYDGVVNGIFTDAAATLPAGTFTAPNTFTPSGLPGGVQTLYAKITPQGGGCVYVVPFTYEACAPVATPTGTLTWTGSVNTDWNTACNWSPSSVPTATNVVVIPNTTNKPTISTAAVAQSVEVQAGAVMTIAATHSLTLNNSFDFGSGPVSFLNSGTVQNNGSLVVDNSTFILGRGIVNKGLFYNNSNAEISIKKNTGNCLENEGGTFTNASKITSDAVSGGGGGIGLANSQNGVFNNDEGGEIIIVVGGGTGFVNFSGSIFSNKAKITINGGSSGTSLSNEGSLTNTNRGEVSIAATVTQGLVNEVSGIFDNAGKITVGANGTGFLNRGTFNNNAGGDIKVERGSLFGLQNSGTFTNVAKITISATVTGDGLQNSSTFNNNACGTLFILARNYVNQAGATSTNAGLVQIANNLSNNGTFTNNGVLKYGSLTGTVSNTTNASLIVKNTPTPIFTYGGTYDGVVNGIFTDAAATISAGTFTAPNTFASSGLPAGVQTLYAKVTPQGGGCVYVVPFTYDACALVATPTGILTWTGLVDTDWNTACNWSPVSVPTATNDVVIPNTTNKPTINTAAVAQSVEVQTDAVLTIAATKSLIINGSRTVATFDAGFYNAGTVQNNGQLVLGNTGSVGAYGLFNRAIFNNNTDGEIKIDRSTDTGLLNDIGGTFTNTAKITIGAVASVGGSGLLNLATFNNNTGGEIKIDRSILVGLVNNNNFNNAAKITIGATASVGDRGLVNDTGTFANTAGGEVSIISRVTSPIEIGLLNTSGGTLTNVAKIKVDGATNGIQNLNSSFQNNANGEIKVDNALQRGVSNESGTFTNLAKLSINVLNSVSFGLTNKSIFNNSADGVIEIDGASSDYLVNQTGGTFTNAAKIKLGSLAATEALTGIVNDALFNNNLGGEITINNAKSGFLNSEGTFTNNALITITSSGEVDTHGLINRDLVVNNACGKIIVLKGVLVNRPGYTFTNLGLVQVVDNLENNGTFTNNGVLKYGSLTGTVTNATNASLIVNNTPTPIFAYGGTYNGVVNSIYTDAAATLPAGTFTAPNTFVPSGLPAGVQTLYAKVTPQGGACSYIVPFTFNNTALAPVFTTQPTAISRCSGSSASFTAAATNATGYQWQLNSGGGWSNVPASAPYANGTTATLTISNVAGLNGYQFRCVAIGATVNTNSDPATLTVISKPTITLTTLQQTLNEGNSQTFCDTDANPVNGLQFTVSGLCVVGSPVWRVQVGSGAWSDWSATAPVSQSSNNQPHRYQAACDATCPSTYTSPIELTINYRASVPQNVSLLVDGVTVAVGETKEVCSLVNMPLTVNANCAAGEVILYSVDGGEYSAGVPVGLVDNQFHNYRVRCRKSDGTPSCVESESGVMRLKLVIIPAAPTVSLSPTNSCNPSASFSGQSTCGSLRTVWYNANTNVALPSLPATVPSQTTSYYARCQTENGCVSEKSNVVTFTLTPTQVAPIITASQETVCTGTKVTISSNCPAGSQTFWNTGVTAPSFEVGFGNVTKQTYWAKCIFEGGCQSAESIHKDIYWNAFVVTLINIGQSKSAVKPANDKSLWTSQFITRDGGPELEQSTQVNPTLYHVENANKMAPRYWTINVEACGLGTDGSLTFDMLATPEMGVIRSFNTHENNAPYFMYANREGWTELYGQNHPAYGFYQDNGAGGNVYDSGLPKGLYKLGIRYWDQKGWGSIYPSTRKPQGNVLAYQEYWFRIQSRDGVGVGAARTADSGQQSAVSEGAKSKGQGSDNGKQITDNGFFATVLPNPVTNILRLKVQESKGQVVQAALTDATGREVLQRKFVPETNTHQEEFGVSELASGVYFLRVQTENKQEVLKVLKLN